MKPNDKQLTEPSQKIEQILNDVEWRRNDQTGELERKINQEEALALLEAELREAVNREIENHIKFQEALQSQEARDE